MENKRDEDQIPPEVQAKYIKYSKAIAAGFAFVGGASLAYAGVLFSSTSSLLSVSGIAALTSSFCGGFLLNNSFQIWHKMKQIEAKQADSEQGEKSSLYQQNYELTNELSKAAIRSASGKSASKRVEAAAKKSKRKGNNKVVLTGYLDQENDR